MDRRTEMREAILFIAHEAVEDTKDAKYKNYTRRPQPCQPGTTGVSVSREQWINEEFEKIFYPRKKTFWNMIRGL